MNKKRRLVAYDLVSPGYEAVYTGEKSDRAFRQESWPSLRFTDNDGNIIEQWCVWTWIPQDGEAAWSEETKAINKMQVALGPLDDKTQRIRAHIGSLVLCDPGIPVTIDELLKVKIPSRPSGTERERLARLLSGYTLGLDQWLKGQPEQFLLLDLGHRELGFDPKNEIVRVYAYLGEEKSAVKEWLAACLWHNLSGGGNPRGLVIQQPLIERARQSGISTREWIDSVMDKGSGSR